MRWVILALLAGCVASEAAPPVAGGGAAASVAGTPHASDTYANCVASTPTAVGDVCYPTNSAYTLLSRDGSTWVYRYPGIGFDVTPPPSASWGWFNQGGAAIAQTAGEEVLTLPAETAVGMRGRSRTVPSVPTLTPYYVEVGVYAPYVGVSWVGGRTPRPTRAQTRR